jgi:hypothetical protein
VAITRALSDATPFSNRASSSRSPTIRFEPQRLAPGRVEIAPALLLVEDDVRHAERIEIAAHRGQRRPQLVRDVGEHLATEAVGQA